MNTSKNHAENLLRTLYNMAFLVEARDVYTGGHLWRVSQFSARLALTVGLSKKEVVTTTGLSSMTEPNAAQQSQTSRLERSGSASP